MVDTLGDMQFNWAKMRMTFQLKEHPITLIGLPSCTMEVNVVSKLSKITDVDYSLVLWEVSTLPTAPILEDNITVGQQQLLSSLLQPYA